MMVWTTVSPCGTVTVTVIACCLLNITIENFKTEENREVIVLVLIFITRDLVYQTR